MGAFLGAFPGANSLFPRVDMYGIAAHMIRGSAGATSQLDGRK